MASETPRIRQMHVRGSYTERKERGGDFYTCKFQNSFKQQKDEQIKYKHIFYYY